MKVGDVVPLPDRGFLDITSVPEEGEEDDDVDEDKTNLRVFAFLVGLVVVVGGKGLPLVPTVIHGVKADVDSAVG